MKLINYVSVFGNRTSMRLSKTEIDAIEFLEGKTGNKAIYDYIAKKQQIDGVFTNFTSFVRENIILDLLKTAKGK